MRRIRTAPAAGLEHSHFFLGRHEGRSERRTVLVVILTGTMMVAEIAAGTITGSMALLADGWHMGSHFAALGLTAFAYRFARRHASDRTYTFGTGKVGPLAGFASAMALGLIALAMAYESSWRLISPVDIAYSTALLVAVIGLAVNVASALLLRDDHHDDEHGGHRHEHHHDHNLKAAYVHVLADALTSVLAIVALVGGMLLGLRWLDPVTGIVGAGVMVVVGIGASLRASPARPRSGCTDRQNDSVAHRGGHGRPRRRSASVASRHRPPRAGPVDRGARTKGTGSLQAPAPRGRRSVSRDCGGLASPAGY